MQAADSLPPLPAPPRPLPRAGKLPEGWANSLPKFTSADKGLATRLHSQTMLNALAPVIPGFIGGSADLAPSNMTLMKVRRGGGAGRGGWPARRPLRYASV